MLKMSDAVETRDGRPVILLKNDIKSKKFPVVGIVTEHDGSETADVWMADGHYSNDSNDKGGMDLVLVNQPIKPAAKIVPQKAVSKAKADLKAEKQADVPTKAEISATATKRVETAISQEAPDAEDDLKDLEDKSPEHPIVKHNGVIKHNKGMK